MSSPSQAVTNNLSAYTNDPRYRFKHEDESQPVPIDHSKSKTAQNKIFINRTAAASNSSSSFNATTLKQNTNDTIINPYTGQQSDNTVTIYAKIISMFF